VATNEDGWVATTHDWSLSVDVAHLDFIRAHQDRYCPGGALHLLLEVMAYANDEARELGRLGRCQIALPGDGSVIVSDDGRGTDTRHSVNGGIVRKPVMSTKDLRFFDADDPERLPDAFPRRGASVVAALSTWLVHINRRSDGTGLQRYEHGIPIGHLQEASGHSGEGTTVHYLYETTPLSRSDVALVCEPRCFPWLAVALHG
jgi:DNA gyrase subunit B